MSPAITNIDISPMLLSDQRVLVKFFAKKEASVWMKLDNMFPFDGLESFEKNEEISERLR